MLSNSDKRETNTVNRYKNAMQVSVWGIVLNKGLIIKQQTKLKKNKTKQQLSDT